jgi:SRSO17 transposase
MAQTHYQRRQQRSLRVELTFVRVTPVRDQLPGSRCWTIFRRSLGAQHETKFYVSNALADCPQAELTRITGMRWPVETALEEAKMEVGLDHYTCTHRQVRCETRTWQGWHHHMLQSFLAHLCLMRLRPLLQKKPCPHDRTSPSTGGGCLGRRDPAQARSPGHPTLPPIP